MSKRAAAKKAKGENPSKKAKTDKDSASAEEPEKVQDKPTKSPEQKTTKEKKAKKDEESKDEESKEEETSVKPGNSNQTPKTAQGTPKEDTPESLAGETDLIALLGLEPSKFLKVSDFQAEFDRITKLLMNDYALEINHKSYRLAELEYYLNDDAHPDIFTHGDELQKTSAQWYFHRVGKGYKGGSYKGLDITFSTRGYGGILIRAIKCIEDNTFIDGPCMVVNTILEACKVKEIADFVALPNFNTSVGKKSLLYLRPTKGLTPLTPVTSGRFGLVLRNDAQAKFVLKPYRYMLYPLEVRKGRQHLVLEQHYNGKTTQEISTLTGATQTQIKKWTDEYDKAAKSGKTASSFYAKKNSAAEFCAFYQVLKAANDKKE